MTKLELIIQELADIKNKLFAMKTVFNFEEAASHIGVSPSTLYKFTSTKIIPFSKPNGKKIFFSREKLDDWLLSNEVLTVAEREKIAANHPYSKNKPTIQKQIEILN